MTQAPDPLAITARQENDRAVVVLDGELDLHGAPKVTATVERLVEAGSQRVEVDAENLHFVDSAGLKALLAARQRAQDAGAELTVARTSAALDRIFEMTGLGELLTPGAVVKGPQA